MTLFFSRQVPLLLGTCALLMLSIAPAQAHHFIEITGLAPNVPNGLLSGLAHPLIGPDHLVFLLALALVGWRERRRSMLLLLGVGLLGSAAGLFGPGLPGAELLVCLSLVVEALVLLSKLPSGLLLPAMALHGYVLSSTVLGWSAMPVMAYLIGLMISQGLLLLGVLSVAQPLVERIQRHAQPVVAALLIGFGLVTAIAQVRA